MSKSTIRVDAVAMNSIKAAQAAPASTNREDWEEGDLVQVCYNRTIFVDVELLNLTPTVAGPVWLALIVGHSSAAPAAGFFVGKELTFDSDADAVHLGRKAQQTREEAWEEGDLVRSERIFGVVTAELTERHGRNTHAWCATIVGVADPKNARFVGQAIMCRPEAGTYLLERKRAHTAPSGDKGRVAGRVTTPPRPEITVGAHVEVLAPAISGHGRRESQRAVITSVLDDAWVTRLISRDGALGPEVRVPWPYKGGSTTLSRVIDAVPVREAPNDKIIVYCDPDW